MNLDFGFLYNRFFRAFCVSWALPIAWIRLSFFGAWGTGEIAFRHPQSVEIIIPASLCPGGYESAFFGEHRHAPKIDFSSEKHDRSGLSQDI